MSTIVMKRALTRKPEWRLATPVSISMEKDEHWAIVGQNGSGKTLLADMITARHPVIPDTIDYDFGPTAPPLVSDCIRYVCFRDTYGGDSDRTYFLQQRWNQMEISTDIPTVGEKLEEAYFSAGADTEQRRQHQQHLYDTLGLSQLLDKPLILLSSGELRKYKLCASLFSSPRLLVIDNPFIGLDSATRQQLSQLLTKISEEGSLQLILILSRADSLPPFITHVVETSGLNVAPKIPISEYRPQPIGDITVPPLPCSPQRKESETRNPIVFRDVNIRYGDRTILSHLDWTVASGEHWALQGPNGSGKSTLLSLVCADNPQSYACDITLFGRKRGSGESIWDIKRRIGYVSPEMHRSYRQNLPAIQVVASGLRDSIGLYARPTADEEKLCIQWMGVFGLEGMEHRPFLDLSSGEQRLVLLARAFVKSPELLILDEPLHGLDDHNRQLVRQVIESYCQDPSRTLIMVTHYQEDLPPCIDHTLTLKRN